MKYEGVDYLSTRKLVGLTSQRLSLAKVRMSSIYYRFPCQPLQRNRPHCSVYSRTFCYKGTFGVGESDTIDRNVVVKSCLRREIVHTFGALPGFPTSTDCQNHRIGFYDKVGKRHMNFNRSISFIDQPATLRRVELGFAKLEIRITLPLLGSQIISVLALYRTGPRQDYTVNC